MLVYSIKNNIFIASRKIMRVRHLLTKKVKNFEVFEAIFMKLMVIEGIFSFLIQSFTNFQKVGNVWNKIFKLLYRISLLLCSICIDMCRYVLYWLLYFHTSSFKNTHWYCTVLYGVRTMPISGTNPEILVIQKNFLFRMIFQIGWFLD